MEREKRTLRLDIDCRVDGVSKCIRVPVDGTLRVRQLLELVRQRAKCDALVTLLAVRGETEAQLDPEDVLRQVLDETETLIRARTNETELETRAAGSLQGPEPTSRGSASAALRSHKRPLLMGSKAIFGMDMGLYLIGSIVCPLPS